MTTAGLSDGYTASVVEIDGERALILTALPPPGATAELRAAFELRRRANETGTCACGARMVTPNRAQRRAAQRDGRPLRAAMEHERGCAATDQAIRRLHRTTSA